MIWHHAKRWSRRAYYAVWVNSWSRGWARFLVLGGVAIDLLGPSLQTSGLEQLVPPKYLWAYMIATGVITEIARRRQANGAEVPPQ